jgi:hypothetical protein
LILLGIKERSSRFSSAKKKSKKVNHVTSNSRERARGGQIAYAPDLL